MKDFSRPGLQMALTIPRISGLQAPLCPPAIEVWPGGAAGLGYLGSCTEWQEIQPER